MSTLDALPKNAPDAVGRNPIRSTAKKARPMERLAEWMIANGFATGHGDTIDALLQELRWQISERVTGEREACARVADDYAQRAFAGPHGSDVAGVAAEHIAATIRKRANYDDAPTDPHHGGKIWDEPRIVSHQNNPLSEILRDALDKNNT